MMIKVASLKNNGSDHEASLQKINQISQDEASCIVDQLTLSTEDDSSKSVDECQSIAKNKASKVY